MKLTIIVAGLSLLFTGVACTETQDQTPPPPINSIASGTAMDVDYLCALIPEKYAYYSSRKSNWETACTRAETEAALVTTNLQSLEVFERLIDSLYDSHTMLGRNSDRSPRLIPSGADFWLEWDRQDARVVAVRTKGGADKAGVEIGDTIISLHHKNPINAAKRRVHSDWDKASDQQKDWALNAAAAGFRNDNREVIAMRDNQKLTFNLGTPEPGLHLPPVSAKMINGHIGYIQFNNSLGNSDTVNAFNIAIADLENADAWIIDFRDTPGGGNTSVAEPILGRFVAEPTPYQRTAPLDEPSYERFIQPVGPHIAGPLVVIVGRWTGSMGEGMAIGFDGMNRGLVIGTKMARLAGGTENFTLPKTGIAVVFPTYDLTHLNMTPRHLWLPPVAVIADKGGLDGAGNNDPAIDFAVTELTKRLSTSP
jgi:peptidase S41-like protein